MRIEPTHGHGGRDSVAAGSAYLLDRLDRAMQAPTWARVLLGAGLAAIAVVTTSTGIGALVMLACTVGPRVLVDARTARRRQKLESQLARAADLLARQLATGASLRQAFTAVGTSVPEPLRTELAHVNAQIALGATPARAFREVAGATDSDVFMLAAHAFELHAYGGGDVASTLRRLARIVRDRRAGDLEVASLTVQGRLSGIVVGLAPIAISLFVSTGEPAAIPIWAQIAIELTGWALAGAGIWLIFRLTSVTPRADRVPRRDLSGGELSAAIFAWLGSRVPEPAAGVARVRRDLEGSDLVLSESDLEAVAGQRLVFGVLGLGLGRVAGLTPKGLLIGFAAGLALWFLPEALLRRRLRAVRMAVEAGVPYMCDVLSLALGAGKNLHQALADATVAIDGPLGERLRTGQRAIEVGASLDEALHLVGDSSNSEDVDEVVAALVDARERGGPLVRTLDELSQDMRRRDRLRRQAQARKLPVKIVFPLVFCILPAFVLLGIVPLITSALSGLQF